MKILLPAFVYICNFSMLAAASVLIQPIGIRTLMMTEFGDPVHAIDQSGLTQNYVSRETDFESFYSNHTNLSDQVWSTTDELPGVVDFDMGKIVNLNGMILWYSNPNSDAQIDTFTIQVSEVDDFSNSPISLCGDTARSRTARFSFDGVVSGRYIRLTIKTNNGAERTRIDEIAFAEIIEPSIKIDHLSNGSIAIDYSGVLEMSSDLNYWTPVEPQPSSPFTVQPSTMDVFYRATLPNLSNQAAQVTSLRAAPGR